MTFHPIHYLRVASHFWPWERAFWLALFHDGIEDGWVPIKPSWISDRRTFYAQILCLSRPKDVRYSDYIAIISRMGHQSDVVRMKRADLAENYARAPESLRKRYAKAMAMLA
ncbi:hypothetical protein U0C82_03635 [Fulvimarina sp. 2208YS6-2-32]|uniref:HD domain-containing protein n=1 Tax=Fulvimarina uroteuthidis TaxID=3098149 RepID=A0ABU5HYQ0_9HYPH|nr:hypothetical protein [Fulvimarina sp. 2208YS6-2-32]MDY8108240.1 hypothetical protein [Fulvimarina sp. 2208YS6-2-32]